MIGRDCEGVFNCNITRMSLTQHKVQREMRSTRMDGPPCVSFVFVSVPVVLSHPPAGDPSPVFPFSIHCFAVSVPASALTTTTCTALIPSFFFISHT